jgi:NitT/TauT family transport system substrate-binding protein
MRLSLGFVRFVVPVGTLLVALIVGGCSKEDQQQGTASASGGGTAVQLTLDWKPEPEFGGFYAAKQSGAFAKHGLDVNIKSAGAGAPTWQLVATGQTDFATTAADQVLIARARGADVVALFAVYQKSPQGIMVHESRDFRSIDDVFNNPGTLAAEDNTWLQYCLKKFPDAKVKVTAYTGGVQAFLAKQDYSQQCFITSEPILASRQRSDPQTFLIADAGYNPYTTVVIAKSDTVKNKPAIMKGMVAACREGWRAYLDDPSAANAVMQQLNSEMDSQTFTAGAGAQKPLIETDETKMSNLGVMSPERWDTLSKQLVDLKVIDKPIPPDECYVDTDKLP